MSEKKDALIEKQQNYLDFVLAEQPYRKVMPWDKSNARAELTALRESVTRLKARNDELEQREIGYNAEIERRDLAMEELAESVVDLQHEVNTLRARAAEYDRIAELIDPIRAVRSTQRISIYDQIVNLLHDDSTVAMVAEQARQLSEARRLLTTLDWNDWCDEVDAWLSATVPAPQDAQEKPE